MFRSRKFALYLLLAMILLTVLVAPAGAQVDAPVSASSQAGVGALSPAQRATLAQYAADTWHSFTQMVYPDTGLPADSIDASGTLAHMTSPTNIAMYVWSVLAARDMKIITRSDDAALTNLAALKANFGSYGSGGFFDAVDVKNGQVAQRYLALDQGMIMAAIDNALTADRLRTYFVSGSVVSTIKPLLKMEHFTAGN